MIMKMLDKTLAHRTYSKAYHAAVTRGATKEQAMRNENVYLSGSQPRN
jgi:hypothetical protein